MPSPTRSYGCSELSFDYVAADPYYGSDPSISYYSAPQIEVSYGFPCYSEQVHMAPQAQYDPEGYYVQEQPRYTLSQIPVQHQAQQPFYKPVSQQYAQSAPAPVYQSSYSYPMVRMTYAGQTQPVQSVQMVYPVF